MTDVAVVALVIAGVSLGRERIRSLPVTTPMLFVGLGLLFGPELLGLLELDIRNEVVVVLAEFTLALVLFSDAMRIETGRTKLSVALPARLLGIGLPLTILLGTVVTKLLLNDLSWAEAALVATVLAPTDAALGEAVVSNPAVPVRIRQALNVESGTNDGLVVPVFSVFLALVAGSEFEGAGSLFGDALTEIAIGLGVGGAVAVTLGIAVPWVTERGWTNAEGCRLVTLGAGLASYAGAEVLGGNGFLAAFSCGIIARVIIGPSTAEHGELAEDLGQLGASATFMVFGALLVIPSLEVVSLLVAVCAVALLTVGRMMPVAISMIGSGLRSPTVVFLGWFGPRGLASMLFGLLLAAEGDVDPDGDLFSVIVLVVLSSVILHGVTAAPGAKRYANWFNRRPTVESMPENEVVAMSPVRWRRVR